MDVDAASHTVLDLSPKLLARVFTFAVTNVVAVSHVCRLWRAVALQTPQLWSTLSIDLSPSAAAAFLERSQTEPLDVRVVQYVLTDVQDRILTFLHLVLPHASRWSSFVVDVPVEKGMEVALECCAEGLAGRVLELDVLRLRVNSNTSEFSRSRRAYPTLDAYALPFMPRHLVLDAVPVSQPTPFSPQLSVLELRNLRLPAPSGLWQPPSQTIAPDMADFLALLQQAPNLQSLTIASSKPTLTNAALPFVSLPLLASITVQAVDALALGAFFERVSVPALTHLDITWAGREQQAIEPLLACLPAIAPHLRTLRIATVAEVPDATWASLFAGLQHLQHVALEATGAGIGVLSALVAPPALTSITLRHQDEITPAGLEALARARMGRADVWPLQHLEVAWCERVHVSDVQALSAFVPHVVMRNIPDEDDEEDLEFAMEVMAIDDSVGEDDDDDSGSDMDDENDEQDWEADLKAELESLRESVAWFPLFPADEKTLTWMVAAAGTASCMAT